MNDVPRTANGWPTVEPNFFTMEQLMAEAQRWWGCANNSDNTVGKANWLKYTGELVKRGFMDEVDVRAWARRGQPTLTQVEGKWIVEFHS